MAHCGLGDRAAGVAEYDADVSLGSRFAVTPPPSVARVQPGADITAGDEIVSDANGKAIPKTADVAASLATGSVGSNTGITWTAKTPGTGGNAITVAITNPGGTVAAEVVTVNGNAISVAARTSGGSITSTAAQIIAAVQQHGAASELVSVANTSTSTGAGTVSAVSATNLSGGLDNDGSGHVNGVAQMDAASSDRFVEVALV
jgi:hypothetical protein